MSLENHIGIFLVLLLITLLIGFYQKYLKEAVDYEYEIVLYGVIFSVTIFSIFEIFYWVIYYFFIVN